MRLPRSLRKPLKSCLVLLGKHALQSVLRRHWPPDRPARLSGRVRLHGIEGVPALREAGGGGKGRDQEQPLGADRAELAPAVAGAGAGGGSRRAGGGF